MEQSVRSSPSKTVTPQEVLMSLMNDGTFDHIRHKIMNQLKHNEELKKYTTTMMEQSQTLNTPGAEQKSRRELFVALREELEGPVLERASKATWELILSKDGVGKEISDTVFRAYNQLRGKEELHKAHTGLRTTASISINEIPTQGNAVSQLNGHVTHTPP